MQIERAECFRVGGRIGRAALVSAAGWVRPPEVVQLVELRESDQRVACRFRESDPKHDVWVRKSDQ